MAKIKFDGLNQFGKELKKMEQNAKRMNGKKQVPFNELFTRSFMRKYTNHASIDELFEAGGYRIKTNDDLDAIPQGELDALIAKNTRFRSWEEMLDEAVSEYVTRQLGF